MKKTASAEAVDLHQTLRVVVESMSGSPDSIEVPSSVAAPSADQVAPRSRASAKSSFPLSKARKLERNTPVSGVEMIEEIRRW
jgi:hypothetical protein